MSLESILIGKQFTAIEIFSLHNENKYSFLKLEQKKNELQISEKEIFKHVDDLNTHQTKAPTILILNNFNVLQKEIIGSEHNDKKLVHKAFPNIKLEEFYYEIWRKDTQSIIAICRKQYVEEICKVIVENFNVSGISLGICSLTSISGFQLPPTLTTNTQSLQFNKVDNLLDLLDSNNKIEISEYSINGLSIPNTHLLPFTAILQSILKVGVTSGSVLDISNRLHQEFKQRAFFSKALVTFIAITLSALLINFLLFSYYYDEAQQLDGIANFQQENINNIAGIEQRIKQKQQQLENFTENVEVKSSELINNIVKTLPSTILLSEISYHPLEKKIKENEPVIARDSVIIITGSTISNESFTSWIRSTEKLDEIKAVSITSFGKDENNITTFNIKIDLK